jgi:hypothetical protein
VTYKQLLEQALEALETGQNHGIAIDKLRRALAAPVQEPLSIRSSKDMSDADWDEVLGVKPPAAQPAPVHESIEDFKKRLASAIDAMPFGDTAASFAVFIRNFK